jgi:hypothetical protein
MKLPLYKYRLSEEWAETCGEDSERQHFGVLAQELAEVIPDAVRHTSNVKLANGGTIERLMVVDKERLFMESVGAMQELGRLASSLQKRVDELETRSTSASTCNGECRRAHLKRRDTVATFTDRESSRKNALEPQLRGTLRRRTSCPEKIGRCLDDALGGRGERHSEEDEEFDSEREPWSEEDEGDFNAGKGAQPLGQPSAMHGPQPRHRMFKAPPGAVIIHRSSGWQASLPSWLGLALVFIAIFLAAVL